MLVDSAVKGENALPYAMSLCVDCYNSTAKAAALGMGGNPVAQDCSYNPFKLYISPCANPCEYPGHPNMTKYTNSIGVMRLLSVVYAPFDEAPTLLGIGMRSYMQISKTSVTFKARMSGRGQVFCLAKPMLNTGTAIDTPTSVEEIRYAGVGTRATLAARVTSQSTVQEWGEVMGGNRGYGFATTTPNMKIIGLAPATNYSVHCMHYLLQDCRIEFAGNSCEARYQHINNQCAL